jgi:hypothetical protein
MINEFLINEFSKTSTKWLAEWESFEGGFYFYCFGCNPNFIKMGRENYRITNLETGQIEQKITDFKFAIWLSARDYVENS